jgi:hypothetical protein
MSEVFGIEFERRRLLPLIVTSHAILGDDGLNLLLGHCLLQAGSGKSGIASGAGKNQNAGGHDADPRGIAHVRYCACPISF